MPGARLLFLLATGVPVQQPHRGLVIVFAGDYQHAAGVECAVDGPVFVRIPDGFGNRLQQRVTGARADLLLAGHEKVEPHSVVRKVEQYRRLVLVADEFGRLQDAAVVEF